MPLSNAGKQQAFRERRARHITGLEEANAALTAETARLRRELATLEASLADALVENERLARPVCKHPAETVLDGRCHQCGADIW